MSELIDRTCDAIDEMLAELARLRKVNATMLTALVQARGALLLDTMVDQEGKPYGTTVVALEAIAAAIAA